MNNRIINIFESLGIFIISLITLIFLVALLPALTLWSINTIAEESGSKFYIPHNLFTYISVLILWLVLTPMNHLISKK